MESRVKKYQTQKKGLLKLFLPYIIFLVGTLITAYPFMSQFYYRFEARDLITNYKEEVKRLKKEEIEQKKSLARAYNATLKPSRLNDPFTDLEKKGYNEYARMLAVKERLGYVSIPSIGEDIPIYAGTSEEILEKGAGYLEGTSLPVGGNSTHTVITAHTGLHKAKLFTDLDKVKKGEIFYIHVLDEIMAYQVDQILVIEPTEFEHVLVEENKEYATLLTCTPYGVNSHRLLVRGVRVPYDADKAEERKGSILKDWLVFLVILFIAVLIGVFVYIKKKNKQAV